MPLSSHCILLPQVVDLVTAVVWTELATTEADFGVNPTATAASVRSLANQSNHDSVGDYM